MLTKIAEGAGDHQIRQVIGTAARERYHMVNMILCEFHVAPITLPFLSLQLILNILSSMHPRCLFERFTVAIMSTLQHAMSSPVLSNFSPVFFCMFIPIAMLGLQKRLMLSIPVFTLLLMVSLFVLLVILFVILLSSLKIFLPVLFGFQINTILAPRVQSVLSISPLFSIEVVRSCREPFLTRGIAALLHRGIRGYTIHAVWFLSLAHIVTPRRVSSTCGASFCPIIA